MIMKVQCFIFFKFLINLSNKNPETFKENFWIIFNFYFRKISTTL